MNQVWRAIQHADHATDCLLSVYQGRALSWQSYLVELELSNLNIIYYQIFYDTTFRQKSVVIFIFYIDLKALRFSIPISVVRDRKTKSWQSGLSCVYILVAQTISSGRTDKSFIGFLISFILKRKMPNVEAVIIFQWFIIEKKKNKIINVYALA